MIRVHTAVTGYPGGSGQILHYFAGPGAATTAEATEAVARVSAFWVAIKGLCATTMLFSPNNVVDEINPATGDITSQLIATAVSNTAGTATGDHMPGAAAFIVQYLTGVFLNGRQVRGRAFVGQSVESQNDPNGNPTGTSTAITAGGKLALQIVTPLTHVVWHRPGPHGAGSAVAVASYGCSSKWGYWRHHG